MTPFTRLDGIAAPLDIENVDTDMIIPKQFLKTTTRTGLSKGLFHELATDRDGKPDPSFVLNRPEFAKAEILLAGNNFGCGSSREHAPWALLDRGIRCVIAPSFADIFYNNCFKNGILPIVLPREAVEQMMGQSGGANHRFSVDLANQTVTLPDGHVHTFDIEPSRKQALLEGLDDIAATLKFSPAIESYEAQRKLQTPWLEPNT